MTNPTTALTLSDRAKAIDRIAGTALAVFGSAESFESELIVAQAVGDLRAALTPEVMQPVMELMNTSIGFRTDRDPSQIDSKTQKPHIPYAVEVVRECFIEAKLRAFRAVGNEWNIIAGRFYGCQTGFERLVKSHPKVTDLKDTFEVPRIASEKGAIVKCRAEWRQDGVKQSIEREFAVRINAGMGSDAITGKAKRKLYAAVHSRLTGRVTPEGEVGDDAVIDVRATTIPADPAEMFKTKTTPGMKAVTVCDGDQQKTIHGTDLRSTQESQTQPTQAPTTSAKSDAEQVADAQVEQALKDHGDAATLEREKRAAKLKTEPVAQTAPKSEATTAPKPTMPQDELAAIVVSNGYTFDHFQKWAIESGQSPDAGSWSDFTEVPAARADRWIAAKRGLLIGLKQAKESLGK